MMMENVVHNIVDTLKDTAVVGSFAIANEAGLEVSGVDLKDTGVLIWIGGIYTVFRIWALVRDEIRKSREHQFKMINFASGLKDLERIKKENEKLTKKQNEF